MDNDVVKDVITNAIFALRNDINNTLISTSEKNALIKLLEKILTYYKTNMDLILRNDTSSNKKIAILQSYMTDIIVKICNVLTRETDIHYFVSEMNKELDKKKLKKIIYR